MRNLREYSLKCMSIAGISSIGYFELRFEENPTVSESAKKNKFVSVLILIFISLYLNTYVPNSNSSPMLSFSFSTLFHEAPTPNTCLGRTRIVRI